MLLSQLFTKTRKEAPKDEVAKNAELLIRGGFIHKEMAGVYAYLPLGLRVLSHIEDIIREEMDAIGGEELILTALQNPELWKKSDRWEQDVWFKTQLNTGVEVGLGWTQEEQLVGLLAQHISSYKDLPVYAYQIQTKFRNEERAKNGILRGREFRMKDLYSFHESEEDLDLFYEKAKGAYKKVFERVGLGDRTYLTVASGGDFSKYSHEFQTLSDAGEDTIYLSEEKNIAVNKEVYTDDVLKDLQLKKETLTEHKAIEVGNIFKLGTRFSEALGLSFKDKEGKQTPVVMGSYGIGSSRLMGTVVEVYSDEKGIIWPESIAPFQYHLIEIPSTNTAVKKQAEEVYKKLIQSGREVLYDNREESAGVKFADADLIGISTQLIISEKTLEKGSAAVEIKNRKDGSITERTVGDL